MHVYIAHSSIILHINIISYTRDYMKKKICWYDIFYILTNFTNYYINSTKEFIKNKFKLLKIILFSKNLIEIIKLLIIKLFNKLFRYNNILISTLLSHKTTTVILQKRNIYLNNKIHISICKFIKSLI